MNRAALAAILPLIALHATAAEKCDAPPESNTDFGRFVDFSRPLSRASSLQVVADNMARYMRINFAISTTAPNDWILRIYDLSERPLQAIDAKSVRGAREFWSARLPGHGALLRVEAGKDDKVLDTIGYVEMPQAGKGQYYSLKQAGAPDWQDLYISNVSTFKIRRGESVGMLVGTYGSNASGHFAWTCSGVVIARDPIRFLTAAHCGAPELFPQMSWRDAITGRMLVDLSWDGDTVSREYAVEPQPRVFEKADVAVLTLKSLDKDAAPPVAMLRTTPVQIGEHLFVIHHPESQQKKISDNCTVLGQQSSDGIVRFRHQCDTESGSSGAPVFDEDGKVAGIHVTGYERMPNGDCDRANKAVSSSTIQLLMQSHQ